MSEVPIFIQQQPGAGGVSATLTPQRGVDVAPAPDFSGLGADSKALAGFGKELTDVAVKLEHAQNQTRAATATTDYLNRLDALEQQYQKDPDFQNAPGNFQRDHGDLVRELSAKIPDDMMRARAVTEWTRNGIASSKRVRETAWGREVDTNVAATNDLESAAVRNAAAAPPASIERLSAADGYFKQVDQAVDAGWLNETERAARRKRFNTTLDVSDVQQLIRNDPEKAAKVLADPKMFGHIDPLQRQQWISAANRPRRHARAVSIVNRSARFQPGRRARDHCRANLGHQPGALIFDKGIIPTEGGVKDGVALVSGAGAIGVSQILPGTAREMAQKSGLADVAALDDEALKARLKDDHALNYKLGLSYWNEQAKRYSGNIPVMMAAYNAGPVNADKWLQAATDKFGPGFSAEQFASVVSFKETRDYIGRAYEKLGAEPSGGSLSPEGRFHASTKIGAKLAADEAERIRAVRDIATSDRLTSDPLALMQAGYQPDPAALNLTVQRQLDASRAGDPAATKYLMQIAEQKRIEPMVRGAYGTAPVVLDQTIADWDSKLANAPAVTNAEKNSLDALKAVRDEVKKRKDTDPVTLGARAGLYAPIAIDPQGNPDDPAWRAGLSARGNQALAAQKIYQGTAAPFMPQEAAALKERWSKAGEGEQFSIVTALHDSMPEAARDAALEQIGAGKGAKLAAQFADRPALAREILHGAALNTETGIDKKGSAVRDAARNTLGGEVYPSADMQDNVIDAAVNVYTARRGNALYDPADSGAIEKAIEAVAGPMVKRNGRKVPVAPGMSAGTFEHALDNLTRADLDNAGGAVDRNGREFDPRELGQRAQLVPLGPGSTRYAVLMPTPDGKGAPVMTTDVGPLVLNMADVGKRYGSDETTRRIELARGLRDQFMSGQVLP
jgi:hypothetical protein